MRVSHLLASLVLATLSLACSDSHSPSPSPRPLKFIDIVTNYSPRSYSPTATCGVAVDSTAYCWGSNRSDRLGRSTTSTLCPDVDPANQIHCALQPARVPNAPKLVKLAAGTDYFCGLTADGSPFCWGFSQTSDGSGLEFGAAGATLPGGLHLSQLSAGIGTICGVTITGAGVCWGDYQGGMRGDPTVDPDTALATLTPNPVPGLTFASILTRQYTTCGLTTAGSAYCWGGAYLGGLGDGSAPTQNNCGGGWSPCSSTPRLVSGGHTFVELTAGRFHFCGLTAAHSVWCWGGDAGGALGPAEGDLTTCAEANEPVRLCAQGPVQMPQFGLGWFGLFAGDFTTCGLLSDAAAACWGNNDYGQAGNGGGPGRGDRPVAGGIQFRVIAPGTDHSCGIAVDSLAWCWGENSAGALGDGTGEDSNIPVAVVGPAEP
jgi:alpha-tubulin suppressor-like RCC1 family protein